MASEATKILTEIVDGDPARKPRLVELVYDDFRRLANGYLAHSPSDTVEPTALVHEAYLKLAEHPDLDWRGRSHFFAVGAVAMRQIIVDHARRRGAEKRGGGRTRIQFDEQLAISSRRDEDVLAIEDALAKLAEISEERCEIVVLRFYGGLSFDEIAEVMGTPRRTVQRRWAATRLWLHRELTKEPG